MGIQVQGASGVLANVGGTRFRGLSVQQCPLDYGAFGTYRKAMLSGTMAAGLAAGATVYSFRWSPSSFGFTPGSSTALCVVQRVILTGLHGSATAFTAGFGSIQMFFARSFTTNDSAGVTGAVVGNANKLRTAMGNTILARVQISNVGAITAGTRTLDTDPMGQFVFAVGTVVSVNYRQNHILFGDDIAQEMPAVLAPDEGFVVRATVPATGTWQFGIATRWAEVTAY